MSESFHPIFLQSFGKVDSCFSVTMFNFSVRKSKPTLAVKRFLKLFISLAPGQQNGVLTVLERNTLLHLWPGANVIDVCKYVFPAKLVRFIE